MLNQCGDDSLDAAVGDRRNRDIRINRQRDAEA
jgi:hypothetical protein